MNHYYVYVDGQLRNVQPGTATQVEFFPLTPGTSYRFTARAVIDPDDYLGNGNAVLSVPSNAASTTTRPDVTPPGAPSLSVTRTDHTSITLGWSTYLDNAGGTLSFDLSDGDTTVHVTPDPGPATYTFTGLQPDTTHSFTARATDAAGNVGPVSAPVTATTPEDVAPSAPSGLTFDAATKVLHWQPAADNRTPQNELRYELFADGRPVDLLLFWPFETSADLQLEIDCGTFVPDGSYTVRAVDAAGNVSGASNAVGVRLG